MKEKLSIIIPCYNEFKYVEEALDSAIEQNWKNKEIIVVDDGSDTQTKELLKKLEPKMDILITTENCGLAAARNTGIQKSKGKYILVWDADDYFEKSFCEKAISSINANPEIKLVTSITYRFNENGVIDTYTPAGGSLKNFLFGNSAMGSTLFLKKDWEKEGGYDNKMRYGYEDWEFYLRLLKEGGKAHVIAEPLFYYRQKPDSLRHQANSKRYELYEYIFKKNKDIYLENFEIYTEFLMRLLRNKDKELQKSSSKSYLKHLIKKMTKG